MKISRLSNTVRLAFLLAGTPLLLAEEDKTYRNNLIEYLYVVQP